MIIKTKDKPHGPLQPTHQSTPAKRIVIEKPSVAQEATSLIPVHVENSSISVNSRR